LEFTSKLKQQENQENMKKVKKVKLWHGCWKTCHDLEPRKWCIRHYGIGTGWHIRVMIWVIYLWSMGFERRNRDTIYL